MVIFLAVLLFVLGTVAVILFGKGFGKDDNSKDDGIHSNTEQNAPSGDTALENGDPNADSTNDLQNPTNDTMFDSNNNNSNGVENNSQDDNRNPSSNADRTTADDDDDDRTTADDDDDTSSDEATEADQTDEDKIIIQVKPSIGN